MIGILFAIGFVFIGYQLFGGIKNPYIRIHKNKWKNEQHYRDYLKWLDSRGGDNPLPEVKLKEDDEIINEVNKYINS